jgi:methylthioribose-1-phosphate isomerase
VPSPTLDFALRSGDAIPIETRAASEVLAVTGRGDRGETITVRLAPPDARAVNYAFDVTPARLVTGLLTERGIARATSDALDTMFPERAV